MKSLSAQFIDWVGQQDPEATFKAIDATACAVYRFLKEAGFPVSMVGVHYWYDRQGEPRPLSDQMTDAILAAHAASDAEGTSAFGALASRLTPLPAPKAETVPA